EVQKQFTTDVFFADVVGGDVVVFRPFGNVFVEQRLGILGRPILAVVIDREGQRRTARLGRAGSGAKQGEAGRGKRGEQWLTAHEHGSVGVDEIPPVAYYRRRPTMPSQGGAPPPGLSTTKNPLELRRSAHRRAADRPGLMRIGRVAPVKSE